MRADEARFAYALDELRRATEDLEELLAGNPEADGAVRDLARAARAALDNYDGKPRGRRRA